MQFRGMNAADARAFAEEWLPARSGNRPELLASFYTLDAFYSDPVVRENSVQTEFIGLFSHC